MLNTLDRTLHAGDVVELGAVVAADVAENRGGGIDVRIIHSGDTEECVLLNYRFTDGDELDVAEGSTVLAVTDGQSFANPLVWVAVPRSEYGGTV